jgi:hypothetical protein
MRRGRGDDRPTRAGVHGPNPQHVLLACGERGEVGSIRVDAPTQLHQLPTPNVSGQHPNVRHRVGE